VGILGCTRRKDLVDSERDPAAWSFPFRLLVMLLCGKKGFGGSKLGGLYDAAKVSAKVLNSLSRGEISTCRFNEKNERWWEF